MELIDTEYLSFILTYKFSQDYIEMLFSAIRAKGGFNNNPTVSQFEAAYKSIIVHSEIKSSSSANCMALDDTTILRVSSSNIKVKDTQSELLDLLCVAGTENLEDHNLLSIYQHSNFIDAIFT
jgi:DNA transposase THAP9